MTNNLTKTLAIMLTSETAFILFIAYLMAKYEASNTDHIIYLGLCLIIASVKFRHCRRIFKSDKETPTENKKSLWATND